MTLVVSNTKRVMINNKTHNRHNQDTVSQFKQHRLKTESVKLSKYYKNAGNIKKAKRCEECGTFLTFDIWQHRKTEEQKRSLESANFCKARLCPMCAWIKQRKLANKVRSILKQIETTRPVKYIFLTLTVKNPPLKQLHSTLKTMNKAWKLITTSPEFKQGILGYIRALEVLGGNTMTGDAHPHYHILCVVKPSYFKTHYISQAHWSQLWQRALKVDYVPIVDVRRIRPKSEEWTDTDSAIFEALKYIAKPQNIQKLSQPEFEELDHQARYAKQYTRGGVMKINPTESNEFSPEEWERISREYYQWAGNHYVPYHKRECLVHPTACTAHAQHITEGSAWHHGHSQIADISYPHLTCCLTGARFGLGRCQNLHQHHVQTNTKVPCIPDSIPP